MCVWWWGVLCPLLGVRDIEMTKIKSISINEMTIYAGYGSWRVKTVRWVPMAKYIKY